LRLRTEVYGAVVTSYFDLQLTKNKPNGYSCLQADDTLYWTSLVFVHLLGGSCLSQANSSQVSETLMI